MKFKTNPNEAIEKLQKEALTLYQNGKLAEVKKICERILQISPKNVLALEISGVNCLVEKRFDDAIALYTKLISVNPKISNAYTNRGIALKALGKIDLAIQNFDVAISLNQDDAKSYYNRANALIALKKFENAVSDYKKAIILKPNFAEAYENLGGALIEKMQYSEALQNLEKAVYLNPTNDNAIYNRGKALHKIRRYEEAIRNYDGAIALNGSHFAAINDKGLVLHELQNYEEALIHFKQTILINPDYAEAYCNGGNTLSELKRFDEALASFNKAIELKPDFAEAYSGRGNTLRELKRLDEALASYNKAIELKPDNAEAHSNRGNILKALKRFDEALASYNKAIELKPDFAEAYSNRGNTLLALWRLDEALASFNKAIELKPGFAEAYNNRGNTLKALGRLDEALASFNNAIELKPNNVEAQSNLAKLPNGIIPDHLASLLLQQWVCPSDKTSEAKALFLKAGLLRHLRRYQESFDMLLNANVLRQKEFEEKIEGWREGNLKFQKEISDWQAIVRDGTDANAPKLLFILGPSRSGKTTIEFSIPENEVTKRGFEGRRAPLAIRDLQDLALAFYHHHQAVSIEVVQKIIDSLFYRQADATNKITHQLVTNTNPFLIRVAHLIFDLYPNSYFIFVYRDPIDNAADIFSTDYIEPPLFAYHAQTALDYVNWYHAVSDRLARKMEGRALKLYYADFTKNTELHVKSIAKLVGVNFEADPLQLDLTDRTDTSVYRKLFLELLDKS